MALLKRNLITRHPSERKIDIKKQMEEKTIKQHDSKESEDVCYVVFIPAARTAKLCQNMDEVFYHLQKRYSIEHIAEGLLQELKEGAIVIVKGQKVNVSPITEVKVVGLKEE